MSDKFVVDADAFRFYLNGSEGFSTPIAAEDTDIDRDLTAGDVDLHLRYRVQETGGGSVGGSSTDDYQLQYRKNGGGSFVDVTASSTDIRSDTDSNLTDDDPTTNRATGISDGSGSFFAGIQEEGDGEITDFLHEADNFTEHVWALTIVAADVIDNDFYTFRLRLNGGNMDNAVVPRIDITVISAGTVVQDPIMGPGIIPFAR